MQFFYLYMQTYHVKNLISSNRKWNKYNNNNI